MNERIKELSNKAVLSASATYAPGPDAIWLKEYNKKFAELLLKECLHIVDDEGCGEGGSVRAIEKIKQHFGVEE